MFFLVSSPMSMRLVRYASAHSANVRTAGFSIVARSTSAGFRPPASSPAIRSRLVFASFNVRKLPPCTMG